MKFVHTNIAAKDWKRLSQFYITVFDCRVKPPERKYAGDWLDQATGLFRASLEGVHLELPGFVERKVPGIGTLVFVYFKDPEGNIIEIQSWEKE